MDCIWVYTSVTDDEHLMPFFMRHYLTVADKIFFQDCGSVDRTREIAADMGAIVVADDAWGMDEDRRRNESEIFVRESKDKTEWCVCVDSDEFVVGDYVEAMNKADAGRFDVMHTIGCNMLAPEFPKGDGRQIYDIVQTGVISGASKPIIVRPGTDFRWPLGRHFIESKDTKVSPPYLYLLHFRYLGVEYTRERNARNWDRSPDNGTAWCCSEAWTGDGSVEYVQRLRNNHGDNVVDWIKSKTTIKPIHGPFPPHLGHLNEQLLGGTA